MPPLSTPPPSHPSLREDDPGLLGAVVRGEARLTRSQALGLLREAPTHELGRLADARCRHLHGDAFRTYVIDRNINYTNVCTARCTFCAFRRDADDEDAYALDQGRILEKVGELVEIGGTQILMQGGMNPALGLEWYESLLRAIKGRYPSVHVHAFSPPEFIEFVRFFDPGGETLEAKLRGIMVRLREAGLDSIPGGGGEIFARHVRRKIGLGKCDAEAWLTTMHVAHRLGMFTSATMMFGHIEGLADRVHHMGLIREWQDRALRAEAEGGAPPGHYVAFIAWPFQRENTPLGRVPDWGEDGGELDRAFPGDVLGDLSDADPDDPGVRARLREHPLFGRRVRRAGAVEYLRTQAVSRLFLDNVYSIGASWVTMGPHVGQVALAFGANDMGSVMMEENVVSAAGTTYCLDEALLCRLIREAGFVPAQRDNTYDILRIHAGEDSPDLRVADWSEHRARRLHTETGGKSEGRAEVSVGAS